MIHWKMRSFSKQAAENETFVLSTLKKKILQLSQGESLPSSLPAQYPTDISFYSTAADAIVVSLAID